MKFNKTYVTILNGFGKKNYYNLTSFIEFSIVSYLLQPSFHFGPDDGSNTKIPYSHSAQLQTPFVIRL